MLNKALLIGRLGKDPEMRHTATGAPVCTMSIATNSFRIDRNTGEKSNTTEWHNIVCWNRTAENVSQYLRKGSLVYVEGRIQSRTWQAQDGTMRNITEIVASDVKFLDSKGSREGFQGAGGYPQQQGAWQGGSAGYGAGGGYGQHHQGGGYSQPTPIGGAPAYSQPSAYPTDTAADLSSPRPQQQPAQTPSTNFTDGLVGDDVPF